MAIKINIGTLNDGTHEIELVSDSKELGLESGIIKDKLYIYLEMFKTSNQLDLRINLKGKFILPCDKCLEMYEHPFENDFELVYVQQAQREEKFDDDYVKSYSPHMKTIDITDDIRQFVLLSIPMKHVPVMKDDGTCTWCGKTKEYWESFLKEEE
ncbi:MAG: DUF177 domain-containing protein [Ignavibacteriae bacterium]|nr:MAG: DUF177 domain-containing protein [Ignavibacteriota bacterium]